MLSAARYALVSLQLAAMVASAFLVLVTYQNADQVEKRLQRFAITKVEAAADAAWAKTSGALQNSDRAERLGALAERFGVEAEITDENREAIIPPLVAYALSDRCADNCGSAAFTAIVGNSVMLARAAELRVGQVTMGEFIVERYDATARGLLLDLRRFGLVNAVTLALMCALLIFKDVLNWRFFVFSVAVTGYAVWAAYGYVYGQDWALSILFQSWASEGHMFGMILASLLFFDWLFLNGIITESVISFIAKAMPS